MSSLKDMINKYTSGESTLEATNKALEEVGANFRLNPVKHILTEDEKHATTIGYYPEQANGYGLLDTGTGSLDKVQVQDGKLVNCNCGKMYALLSIAGRAYHIKGDTLVE